MTTVPASFPPRKFVIDELREQNLVYDPDTRMIGSGGDNWFIVPEWLDWADDVEDGILIIPEFDAIAAGWLVPDENYKLHSGTGLHQSGKLITITVYRLPDPITDKPFGVRVHEIGNFDNPHNEWFFATYQEATGFGMLIAAGGI